MKIVDVQTMQQLDRDTIRKHGISGLKLMENAGKACADAIISRFGADTGKRAVILAGKGNNGGDGFVIARLLGRAGWQIKVAVLTRKGSISGDALDNLQRLPESWLYFCETEDEANSWLEEQLAGCDLIIDALLGTGLNSPVSGTYRAAIERTNRSEKTVVAVDIPSGTDGNSGMIMGAAVRADLTVTFAMAKPGHIFYPGAAHTGRLVVADIGIPEELAGLAPGIEFIDAAAACRLLLPREREAHKGHFGHCLIIAGSTGKTGAAALAANSAVRAGAGLVTLAVPHELNPILEIKTTEAMTMPLAASDNGVLSANSFSQISTALSGKSALAIGPGIGRHPDTVTLVQKLIESTKLPLVMDADAINAISVDISMLDGKKSPALILTPHPGEMTRLTGIRTADDGPGRIAVARELARRYAIFVILKGARTVMASPDGQVAVNASGNPGMASGGMGDVLTGVIAALCAQGYTAWDAVRLGTFIHGHAADLVAAEKGETGMNATDIQEKLPYAFKDLELQRVASQPD